MSEGTITTNYVKFTDGGMVAAYDVSEFPIQPGNRVRFVDVVA